MKKVIFTIIIFVLLIGCSTASIPSDVSNDFRFSICWGVGGINSYNSETKVLIKDLIKDGTASTK